jgi:hypothetical protein
MLPEVSVFIKDLCAFEKENEEIFIKDLIYQCR